MDSSIDVMISYNVRTMDESAILLKRFMEEMGLVVWICTEDLAGGEEYRDGIAGAVEHAKVMLILLNEEWASSRECLDEFLHAKKLNLKSRAKPPKPSFIPISFKDLNWEAHSHVNVLSSAVNFIRHNGNNLLEGDTDITVKRVTAALQHLGVIQQQPTQRSKATLLSALDHPSGAGFSGFQLGITYKEACSELLGKPAPFDWSQLPIANEYTSKEVRYYFLPLVQTKYRAKYFHETSASSYICLLFTSHKLFRISIRFMGEPKGKCLDVVRGFVAQHTSGKLTSAGGQWHMRLANTHARLEVHANAAEEYGEINWIAQFGPIPEVEDRNAW